jgi:hypothetical protein
VCRGAVTHNLPKTKLSRRNTHSDRSSCGISLRRVGRCLRWTSLRRGLSDKNIEGRRGMLDTALLASVALHMMISDALDAD